MNGYKDTKVVKKNTIFCQKTKNKYLYLQNENNKN